MASVREDQVSRKRTSTLFAGALAPPVAWLVQLTVLWGAEESLCRTTFGGRTGFLILAVIVSTSALAVAVASGVTARRRRHTEDAATGDAAESSDPFFGMLGTASATLFGLLIIATAIPLFFLEPCTR